MAQRMVDLSHFHEQKNSLDEFFKQILFHGEHHLTNREMRQIYASLSYFKVFLETSNIIQTSTQNCQVRKSVSDEEEMDMIESEQDLSHNSDYGYQADEESVETDSETYAPDDKSENLVEEDLYLETKQHDNDATDPNSKNLVEDNLNTEQQNESIGDILKEAMRVLEGIEDMENTCEVNFFLFQNHYLSKT